MLIGVHTNCFKGCFFAMHISLKSDNARLVQMCFHLQRVCSCL